MSGGEGGFKLNSGTVRMLILYAIVRTVAALNLDPLPPNVLDGLADLGLAGALLFLQRRLPRVEEAEEPKLKKPRKPRQKKGLPETAES